MDNRKLAQKGRYGDTKIRNILGQKSHVNKREADYVDMYGLIGEILVKEMGAGTINPLTGLPEYPTYGPGNKTTSSSSDEESSYEGHDTAVEFLSEQRRQWGIPSL